MPIRTCLLLRPYLGLGIHPTLKVLESRPGYNIAAVLQKKDSFDILWYIGYAQSLYGYNPQIVQVLVRPLKMRCIRVNVRSNDGPLCVRHSMLDEKPSLSQRRSMTRCQRRNQAEEMKCSYPEPFH